MCLKVADCTKFGPGQHTNYSAPTLLRVDPNTAEVQIVGELPEANDRHALTSANYHLGSDGDGSVLATYRKYDVPPPPTSGSSQQDSRKLCGILLFFHCRYSN